ncbi:hypothetical protein V8E36_003937 [Tilletia maclaganii]
MPPSRFASSPWRNFLSTPVVDEHRKQSGVGDSALLQASDSALYGIDSAGTTITRVQLAPSAADGGNASHKVGSAGGGGPISALALSPFEVPASQDDLVAVGTQQGSVKVVQAGPESDQIVAEWKLDGFAGAAAVHTLDFHPHSSGLVLAAQAGGIHVACYGADGSTAAQSVFAIPSPEKVQIHAARWSVDGALIGSTSSDQRLNLWDPRASTSTPATSATSVHGAKLRPTKLAFTQTQILTSGFDLGRQRDWAVWDVRALGKGPLHRSSIPSSSTAVLAPVVDADRSLVYLHGKGDASMHVVDLSLAPYTAKATPLPYAATTLALAPLLRPEQRAMKGEIGRLFINTPQNDSIIPVSITIPRRQYLDFHEDLYPPTHAPVAAQDADSWLAGNDAERVRISQDPSRRQCQLQGARQQAGVATPAAAVRSVEATLAPERKEETPTPVSLQPGTQAPAQSPRASESTQSAPGPSAQSSAAATISGTTVAYTPSPQSSVSAAPADDTHKESEAIPAPVRQTTGASASTASTPAASTSVSSSSQPPPTQTNRSNRPQAQSTVSSRAPTTAATPATDWSRRFLAGSTPLLPEFNNVSGISTSLSPESRLLGLTITAAAGQPQPGYLVFPLAGPGGRMGVHPLSQPGRFPLPADLPTLDGGSGAVVVDFACSPFLPTPQAAEGGGGGGGGEVYVLSADSKIRKWSLPVPPPSVPADCLPLGPGAKRQPTREELERSRVRLPARAELVLDASGAAAAAGGGGGGRVVQVEPHPLVRGVVGALVAGPPARLLVWREVEGGGDSELQPGLEVDVGGSVGAFGFEWSPDGELVAVAGKDKKLRVGDVRAVKSGQGAWAEVAAHDSPRAFKLVWLSNKYLLSTGHGLGSIRQMKLYEVERANGSSGGVTSLKVLETIPLDSSPAVLWPWWDPDTRILLLYARGERAVNAYEVRLPGSQSAAASTSTGGGTQRKYGAAAVAAAAAAGRAFLALPAFGHSNPQQALAFLTKRQVDVANVEVAAAYLLSAKGEIQRVGWSITRARPEFFQDDIFVDTEAVEEPLDGVDGSAWLSGSTSLAGGRRKVSLRPASMQPLSSAPPAVSNTSKLAKGPQVKELTDKEKEAQFLDKAFKKVKGEDVAGADVGTEAAKRAPVSDDWSDED